MGKGQAGAFNQVRPKKRFGLSVHLTVGGIGAACLALVLASVDMTSNAATEVRENARGQSAQDATQQEMPASVAQHDQAQAPSNTQLASLSPQPTTAQQTPYESAVVERAKAPALPTTKTHYIKSGDSLSSTLSKLGVSNRDAYLASNAISKHFDVRRLRAGQLLTATFSKDDAEKLTQVTLKVDAEDTVIASREGDNFKGTLDHVPLTRAQHRASGLITSSLYEGMLDAGIPDAAIVELIHIFSFDVDFQRDIRSGDRFDVYYETAHDSEGKIAKTGPVIYGKLVLRGDEVELYRYKDTDGFTDYYHPDGSSSKKLLMRTPIDGARISSSYGSRRHPVLGYRKMHKGVDFAAPRGTPIKAAGHGTIERAGRNGSFGIYVRIRHNGTYKTAYAHMKGLARGIKKGSRVRQGQTIGYVGTTGRSTGPHLHYEVHKNGSQVNPQSIKLPTGKKLGKTDMARFKAARDDINIAMEQQQPTSLTAEAR